jgi:DNA mismatch repair protein MutS2
MAFDSGTLRPTYRVVVGTAGESAGLAIAERLGLDPGVVASARRRMGPESELTRRYADRLRELVAGAEAERAALETARARLEAERERQAAAAERAERERQEAARRDLDAALDEFRRAVRTELAALNDPKERAALTRRVERAERRLRGEQERHAAVVAPSPQQAAVRDWLVPDHVDEGQLVHVVSLGREGRVARVRGSRVEVQLGRVAFTVDLDDLRVGPGAAAAPAAPVARGAVAEPDRDDVPTELKLLGLTVEEGLEALDRFLDAAVLAGHEEVRIVHGHGTGRLRRAVREHLLRHRQVAGRRPGEPHEGGDGATIARLRG